MLAQSITNIIYVRNMPNVIETVHLTNCNFDLNSNKFVVFTLSDDGTVTSRWGRVGVTEQSKSWSFGSDAKRQFDRKVADKLKVKTGRDAYTKVDILTSTMTSQTSLESVATRDIDVDCEVTRDLIRWLSKVNIHNIVNSTTMTYNEDQGVFRTPLGVVGKSMVDRARVLINEMSPYVETQKYDDQSMKKLASEYLRIIPQDLGAANRKIKVDVIFTNDYLKKQLDILDALDASIVSVLTTSDTCSKITVDPERVFNVKLHGIDDDAQIDAVKTMFSRTRQWQHQSNNFDFKKLYAVDIADMRAKWEADGAKISNHMRLWHGTKPANVLSILKQGLIIPPSTASYVCGRMFSDGIYFSNQSTKSLNYSSGFWGGGDQGNKIFMFLADVAMGNYYVPPSSLSRFPSGYDSIWAQPGKSGIQNDEMIIPRTSQCNLVYLCEFGK